MRWKHLRMVYLVLIVLGIGLISARDYQGLTLVNIISPQSGDAVQGLVAIVGNVVVDDLDHYELAFSTTGKDSESWFPIGIGHETVPENLLGDWDTNQLTDGTYTIRLIVYRTDGEAIVDYAEGVRLRNYTAIETNTPAPTPTGEFTPLPPTPTHTPPPPTPTALPPNPMEVSESQIRNAVIGGAVLVGLFFAGLATYTSYRARNE